MVDDRPNDLPRLSSFDDRPTIAARRTIVRTSESTENSVVVDASSTSTSAHCRITDKCGRGKSRRVFLFIFYSFFKLIYILPPSFHYITHTLAFLYSLLISLSNMNPSNFPNPNSADNDMPMFGGGGSGVRWPGHKDYRIETPGSVGSTIISETELVPF